MPSYVLDNQIPNPVLCPQTDLFLLPSWCLDLYTLYLIMSPLNKVRSSRL